MEKEVAATSPKSSAIAHNADMYTNKAQEGGWKEENPKKRINKIVYSE